MNIFQIIILSTLLHSYNCKKTVKVTNTKSTDHTDLPKDKTNAKSKYGNILFFHHMGTPSHLNFIRPLAKGLAQKGHKVTTALYSPSDFNHANITEILTNDRYVNGNRILMYI